MKIKIEIGPLGSDAKAVCATYLFTRPEITDEGIYNCAFSMPNKKEDLVKILEASINSCLAKFEKDSNDAIDKIIEKCLPKLDEFNKMCGIGE